MNANPWTEIAVEADLPEARGLRVATEGGAVLLVKVSSEIFAIGNQCTHQGAGLDRGVVKVAGSVRTVTCPAHGSMFDLETGKVMRPPATKPIPVYDLKVEDGRVYVRPPGES